MKRLGDGYYLSVEDIERFWLDCGEMLDDVAKLLSRFYEMRKDCQTPYTPPQDEGGIIQFRRPDND